MDEEQAFKRSRNADEMVELRVLLQSKVNAASHHGWRQLLGHSAGFRGSRKENLPFFFFLCRMPALLLERVART